jgi:rSAM/selenodomain-associated transferase 1
MIARRHLVVFARAPRLGAVKRRLAEDVGDLAAWRFYRDCTTGVVRRLGRDARWVSWLAITPDAAARRPPGLWPTPARVLAQGPGDLGARMGRVLKALPPGPAVIVGSDIPAITRAHVWQAFRLLGTADWVFGPAKDGGYWLVATRRQPALRLPFRGVRWGSHHALADTLANLPGRRVALLEELYDVDTAADLARLRGRGNP